LGGGRTYGCHLARPAYPPNCDVCGRDLQRQPYVDSGVRFARILLKKSVIYCRWGDVVIQ
jgi:hypothetical protein